MEKSKILFKDSIELINKHWLKILGFILLPTIPAMILGSIMPEDVENLTAVFIILFLLGVLIQILINIFSFWSQLASYKYIIHVNNGESVKFFDAYKVGWKTAFYFILASIIFYLIFILGMVLFIIPGIIFAVLGGMFIWAVVARQKTPVNSVVYSIHLIWGKFWAFLGKILYPFVRILPFLLALTLSVLLVISSFSYSSNNMIVGILGMVLFGVIFLACFFMLVKYSLASTFYSYKVFIELEKVATPLTPEKESKLRKIIISSAVIGIFACILFAVFIVPAIVLLVSFAG